jgi:hypothetical protein
MKKKPVCETLLPWLKANLGPKCLAPLTGTDARALAAAVHIIELYAVEGNPRALAAFGACAYCMQRSTRELAYHAIAHVLDWSDREKIWKLAYLEPIENPRECVFEPHRREIIDPLIG